MRYPLILSLLIATSSFAADGWKPLFNGKDLGGWETYMKSTDAFEIPGMTRDAGGHYTEAIGLNKDPLKVFNVITADGHPTIHITGQGFGVMQTLESYGNFHLRLQIKWGERRWAQKAQAARDTGLLYFCFGEPGAIDHTWPHSVEFQIQEHDMGDLYALGTQITVKAHVDTTGPKKLYVYDPAGNPTQFIQKLPIGNRCVRLEDAEKPNGEWNTLDLICFEDRSIHIVNGKVVMRLFDARRLDGDGPTPLKAGRICLQTEGAEVYYRNVEIQPITAVPAEYAETK